MHLHHHLLPFATLTTSTLLPPSPQTIFTNLPRDSLLPNTIPTAHDSAILARRILNLTPLGVLSTTFPSSHPSTPAPNDARPADLSNIPIGMMDYIADCESNGNPTILAINIATTFRNARMGSNVSLSLQWTPPHAPSSHISSSSFQYSAANLPRFSLLGHFEALTAEEIEDKEIAECFVKKHPDARYWLPGNKIHQSEWVRLVVEGIYWVGGFGDRAYIGWIDVEGYKNVTRKEWESVRLPGENKGWKEWAVDVLGGGIEL